MVTNRSKMPMTEKPIENTKHLTGSGGEPGRGNTSHRWVTLTKDGLNVNSRIQTVQKIRDTKTAYDPATSSDDVTATLVTALADSRFVRVKVMGFDENALSALSAQDALLTRDIF